MRHNFALERTDGLALLAPRPLSAALDGTMKPLVTGLRYVSERDAGTHWQYDFDFLEPDPSTALRALLCALVPGHAVLFPDPAPGDCYLEVRRTQHGFETKRGCHGAYGTWREASLDEAHQWLLPGARQAGSPVPPRGMLDYAKSGRAI